LVGAPDAHILAAAIAILRKRIAAGTATVLVRVKAHRGEPANKGTDILADKAISDPKVGREWCQRTNRAVFTWKKPCRACDRQIGLLEHEAMIVKDLVTDVLIATHSVRQISTFAHANGVAPIKLTSS